MPRGLLTLIASLAAFGLSSAAALAAPQVVVSIKPLYGLVARVMEGVGEPTLLVAGGASLHTYSLRPSQAALLEQADLVVWVGPGLETFLSEPLETLGGHARVVEAFEVPGVILLPARVGGTWEPHADEEGEADSHDHDHEHEGGLDGHLWLDPRNAEAVTAAVVGALSDLDPANAPRYAANGTALIADIEALDREIAAELSPVKGVPYVVFHDAYQYFEARYGLGAVGSITVSPEQQPGVQRLQAIREKMLALQAVCVFAEPQFQPALLNTVIEGTPARVGTLDPEGAGQEPSPQGYELLMRKLADSLKGCLDKGL